MLVMHVYDRSVETYMMHLASFTDRSATVGGQAALVWISQTYALNPHLRTEAEHEVAILVGIFIEVCST